MLETHSSAISPQSDALHVSRVRWTLIVFSSFILFPLLVASRAEPNVSDVDQSSNRYLELDRELGLSPVPAVFPSLTACEPGPQAIHCAVARFKDLVLTSVQGESTVRENSISGLLATRRGSCAALTALFLSLNGPESPFRAVVLRSHVLVTSVDLPDIYVDLLDGGKVLAADELAGFGALPPNGYQTVDLEGFLPHYAENIAARLANARDEVAARTWFGRAISMAPNSGRFHYNFGLFLSRMGEFEAAETSIKNGIDLGWNEPNAWLALARAQMSGSKRINALSSIDACLVAFPDDGGCTSMGIDLRSEQ